jgi:aconitate hydratase
MFKKQIQIGTQNYNYFSLRALKVEDFLNKLPFSLKILLENLLRFQHTNKHFDSQLKSFLSYYDESFETFEIFFHPARVLMQDFTGVPAIVDLAAMRDACIKQGKDPKKVNPLIPVDLVIDHSVMVDYAASAGALAQNVSLEYERNVERYKFLKWGQQAFKNFCVVPPGLGICHQVNLEYLAQTVFVNFNDNLLYPDSLVGTDSHTTMINALSVLGWGVGGIEAEAAMLGQPLSMLVPEVVGVRLTGKLKEGITATDLVLKVTNALRQKGVVGKFVEFYGEGLSSLSLADRATIANMAPEYGATCGFFPIDEETLKYLELSGRSFEQIAIVEKYAKDQLLWRDPYNEPVFKDGIEIDLSTLIPVLAGPKRPQDKINLTDVKDVSLALDPDLELHQVVGQSYTLKNHDVVLAAITSCTNTSNPSVMIAAGLLAKKACDLGLVQKPWVKTSLAPGSQVVLDYLKKSGLLPYLEKLGFYIVGFGCTTCIGNSGPLDLEISKVIEEKKLSVAGVLSGNRNFEGRIHPHIKENYLASPPLVVAYALVGTMLCDLTKDPIGQVKGHDVYLADIWPSREDIKEYVDKFICREDFIQRYQSVFEGDDVWQSLKIPQGETYTWDENSTYVKCPPYFTMKPDHRGINENARILGLFGDSITTDHISPAGVIKVDSPAGYYLKEAGVQVSDFNSYGSRRGHHEVMMRGTFANIRLQNEMVPHKSGGYTIDPVDGIETTIYAAAMHAQTENLPLVIIAGKEYGTGSSRDWAAKGTRLLGVKAVIAESFERIHRSNLVGMGVIPFVFNNGENRKTLLLTGDEKIDISWPENIEPLGTVVMRIIYSNGLTKEVSLTCRIDTNEELAYFKHGGILPYVLEQF